MNVWREAFPSNHIFTKKDALQPKYGNKATKYTFREDLELDKLPTKQRITQPHGYSWKTGKELLKYAPYSDQLHSENTFKTLRKYYADGIQQHDPLPDFGGYTTGFTGLDKIYSDLYNKPFPKIVGEPEIHDATNGEVIDNFRQRHLNYQDYAAKYAHKPYQYAHYPFLETIGMETPSEHDTMLYKSDVSLNKIYNHFRQDGIPVGKVPHERLSKVLPSHSGKLLNSVKRHLSKPKRNKSL